MAKRQRIIRDTPKERAKHKARVRELNKAGILELLEYMTPTQAADALEIPSRTVYQWRSDPEFAEAWDEIQNTAFLGRLESILAQNAFAKKDNFATICILNARHPAYRSARSARDSDLQPHEYANAMKEFLETFSESVAPAPPEEEGEAASPEP